jgi:hypothetical protein
MQSGQKPATILPSLIPKPATFFNRRHGKSPEVMPVRNAVLLPGHDRLRGPTERARLFALKTLTFLENRPEPSNAGSTCGGAGPARRISSAGKGKSGCESDPITPRKKCRQRPASSPRKAARLSEDLLGFEGTERDQIRNNREIEVSAFPLKCPQQLGDPFQRQRARDLIAIHAASLYPPVSRSAALVRS